MLIADPLESLAKLWANGKRPDLAAFVREVGPVPATQLAALVRLDQLRRWEMPVSPVDSCATNQYAPPEGILVEEYFKQFPQLQAETKLAIDLILNEYSIREELGKRPGLEDYVARFPIHASALRRQIPQRPAKPSDGTDAPRGDTMVGAPAPIAETFGRYRIVKTLGEGGMGKVYLAEDTHLQRSVALKIPHFGGNDGPVVIERFYREARIAAAFHHPNLCPVYDVGEIDGTHYLTMPFLAGEPMSDWLKRAGPLLPAQACRLAVRIAQALHVAHLAGVLHRDLKPANIMLPHAPAHSDPEPVVMDFGLARRGGAQDPQLTTAGAMMGTGAYMPPEQIVGDGSLLGPPADIYSLGGILFQMLTGRTPFIGSLHEVLRAVLTNAPPPPRKFRPDLDPALDAVCLKALAKNPADRYPSMAEFAAALAPFCAGAAVVAPSVAPGAPARRRVKPKSSVLFYGGIGMASLMLGLVAWGLVLLLLAAPESAPVEAQAKLVENPAANIDTRLEPSTNTKPEPAVAKPELKVEPTPEPPVNTKPEIKVETSPLPPVDAKPEVTVTTKPAPSETPAKPGPPLSASAAIRCLAFNPQTPTQLAVGTDDGVIRLWDLSTGTRRVLKGNVGTVLTLAFSPDGKQLASAGGDSDNFVFDVVLWNVGEGRIVATFKGHFNTISSVAFSPNGKILASAAADNSIRLWDAPSGKPQEITRLQGDRAFHAIAFHPKDNVIVSGGADEMVRIWDVASGKARILKGHDGAVLTVAMSPDGKTVASASSDNDVIKLWDVATSRNTANLAGHQTEIRAVAFNHDGTYLVSGSADGVLKLWGVAAGKCLASLEKHPGELHAVVFRPDGRSTASGHKNQKIVVWEMPAAKK